MHNFEALVGPEAYARGQKVGPSPKLQRATEFVLWELFKDSETLKNLTNFEEYTA